MEKCCAELEAGAFSGKQTRPPLGGSLLNRILGDLNRSTQHRRHSAPPGLELQDLAGSLVEGRWCMNRGLEAIRHPGAREVWGRWATIPA